MENFYVSICSVSMLKFPVRHHDAKSRDHPNAILNMATARTFVLLCGLLKFALIFYKVDIKQGLSSICICIYDSVFIRKQEECKYCDTAASSVPSECLASPATLSTKKGPDFLNVQHWHGIDNFHE